jgi:hypothetical protein
MDLSALPEWKYVIGKGHLSYSVKPEQLDLSKPSTFFHCSSTGSATVG